FEAYGGVDAECSEVRLGMGREAELGGDFEAAREDGVACDVEAGEVVRDDLRGVTVDVVLKVLAEETGGVPREAAAVGLQEEAGALDAAETEDVPVRTEDGFDAGEGTAAQAGGGVAFCEEFDCACVQAELEVGVGGEGLV